MNTSPSFVCSALCGLALVSVSISSRANAAVICSSPDLPPSCGEYLPTGGNFGSFQNPGAGIIEVTVVDTLLGEFLNPVITPLAGGDELEEFQATLSGLAQVTMDAGGGATIVIDMPVTLTGPVQTITVGKTGNTTGTFQTEIISMNLTGSVGGFNILLRESPTLASSGQSSITDIGGGQFEIDSFSELFSQVSVDSGPFVPGDSSTVVTLVSSIPEPSSALLSITGLAGLLFGRRK